MVSWSIDNKEGIMKYEIGATRRSKTGLTRGAFGTCYLTRETVAQSRARIFNKEKVEEVKEIKVVEKRTFLQRLFPFLFKRRNK